MIGRGPTRPPNHFKMSSATDEYLSGHFVFSNGSYLRALRSPRPYKALKGPYKASVSGGPG